MTAVHPDGRRLLRIEAKNAETPIERKPGWIRTTARTGPNYKDLQQIVQKAELHTVCREANCPNIFECWEDRESTFLIAAISARSPPRNPRATTRPNRCASPRR